MTKRAPEHWLLPEKPYQTYEAYLATAGDSLEIALPSSAADVVEALSASGLRGRGGAGFPAGKKWQSIVDHPCTKRYVVCNAAEGEPGTFKDRFLLRKNPYATLEGIRIAALTVGADKAFIALKGSFTKEIARVRAAIDEMKNKRVLGALVITVVEGPEEYLFGEEKALLNVIEGEGPLPREADQPPYELGLFAKVGSPNPTLVSNAETFAHAATIARHGAASFRELGTDDTPGTILVTLSGDVAREGVFELPAGVPLEKIFRDQGGGSKSGGPFKAALSGVSAPIILPDHFVTPAAFGPMSDAGLGLGSAGFMLFGESASMVRVAQAIARFLYVESCNQCASCKVNLGVASGALDELFDRTHLKLDVHERALLAARRAPQGNRCYLPVQASALIPSIIRAFANDFAAEERIASGALPWPIPKLVDFDEPSRTFSIDGQQAQKQPNWTYRDAVAPEAVTPPHEAVHEEKAVWLEPDVVAALRKHSPDHPVHRAANEALREWVRARESKP